jgi:RNA polymerase sigma-54 factor
MRHLTTAHLAQTMTLLELTGSELAQKIEAALASNPALELVETRRCPLCRRLLPANGPCSFCSHPPASGEQPVVFVSPRSDFWTSGGWSSEESLPAEEWTAAPEELPVYVLRQVASELAEKDRPLAAHILSSLDDDGLLTVSVLEIARYHHLPPSRVENVLRLIRRADPVGVGSSTPQEALLVQLEALAESQAVPPLAAQAVQEGLDLLSRRAYPELGQRLGISAGEAQKLARFISANLNPYPARAHWGETLRKHSGAKPAGEAGAYQDPDILISRQNDSHKTPLVVEIISPFAGALRVNSLFRQVLADAPAEKAEQWQADLDQANLLVKCLQQRDNTLVRLMQRLVILQREYLLKGDAYLEPITRAQLADDLNVHESTISRAVAGKCVQLPNRRIVPLAKLFDRSLNVRTALRQIVAEEKKPLSDGQLADILINQGFPVARRTVAKYRAMEGILPARLRRAQSAAAPA